MKKIKLSIIGLAVINITTLGLFCASRKCREMQRKVQRLAATFLNFDFGISRR
ncbi:hypothetical protein Q0N71_26310 [Bacillus thuringiensis]|uniref:hypothetical protein n=1 Tax=Bacillus thuringiensis TaxID=1428 RepID=UPI0034595256